MIPPAAAYLKVATRKPFLRKSAPAEYSDRRCISRLHIRLDPVQSEFGEREPQGKIDRLGHVSPAGVAGKQLIPQIRVLKTFAKDLAKIQSAQYLVRRREAHEKKFIAFKLRISQLPTKRFSVERRACPSSKVSAA